MSANPVVATRFGEVEGEWNEGVARFRGIPFAGRIDGAGRFKPARPPARWSGVLKAQTWAPLTPQIPDPSVVSDATYHRFLFGRFYDTPISEEGLYLNVWTPSPDRQAKRPVMVWLHGGGFGVGTPTRAREEPSLISARGDLVVVAPNHRLGAFGYLYLREGGKASVTPNLGMLDIVAALEWVRDNIEVFGGDPSNVTVFGESGGAMKTATLLSMPRAKGLFQRGICQAGVFAKGFRFGPLTPEAADETSRQLMHRAGVKNIDALAALPMNDIIASANKAEGGLMVWRPVVDGEILPENPALALAEGRDLAVPVIVGSALHEADFIFHGAPFNLETVERAIGPEGRRVYEAYQAERRDAAPEEVVAAVLTDWVFGMPAVAFAEARAKSGHPTYVYQMRWGRSDGAGRATHGAENPFVFDRLEATGYSGEAADAKPLSKIMQQAWIAFARTGKPSAEGAPAWPAYAPPGREVMIFDRECRIEPDFKRREREIWRL